MKHLGVLSLVLWAACGGHPKEPVKGPAPGPTKETPTAGPTDTKPPPNTKPAPGGTKTLYDRLGGQPAITAVVEEFVARTTTDPRIKDRFFNTDAANLKMLLVEFICVATGGPCKYTGRDMEASHAGMELVDDEFTALVEDLVGALDKYKVPEAEKGEILAALGPLKPKIVVAADKLSPIDAKKLEAVTKLAATIKPPEAADLLTKAVAAGQRGQRSYAEQLFARAELLTGANAVKAVATTFRAGAPPRITTALKKMPADTAPQPKSIGSSDQDEPDKKPARGSLKGTLKVGGAAPQGLGVVMLWPTTGPIKKRVPKQRVIEQRNKTFAPHVMAVPVGSTISFPNFDNIYHNVFSLSKTKPFDLGLYKSGETRDVVVDKAGIVRLGCNLHAAMSAYLIVVDAPHYVVASADGTFSFASLAPGKYKVNAWSERSGEPTVGEVTIKEGTNELAMDLKAGVVTTSPDKFNRPR